MKIVGKGFHGNLNVLNIALFHSKNVKKTLLNHLLKPHKPTTTQKRKKLLDILFFIE